MQTAEAIFEAFRSPNEKMPLFDPSILPGFHESHLEKLPRGNLSYRSKLGHCIRYDFYRGGYRRHKSTGC